MILIIIIHKFLLESARLGKLVNSPQEETLITII
jgi:hypothetical protein